MIIADKLIINSSGDHLLIDDLGHTLLTGTFHLGALNLTGDPLFATDSAGTPIVTEQTMTMGGIQLAFLPFPPNWINPISEVLEWKTDILQAYNGSEQRRSLRIKPRRSLSYDYMIQGELTNLHDTIIWGWHSRSFAVPMWHERFVLAADVIAGTSKITLNDDLSPFADDSLAVIYVDALTYEIVRVNTTLNGELMLTVPARYSWAAGLKIYPIAMSHLGTTTNVMRVTQTTLTGKFEFLCNPVTSTANIADVAPTETYRGLEIVPDGHNWIDGMTTDFLNEFKMADTGTGAIQYFNAAKSRMTRPFKFFLKGKAKIKQFREFLARCRGQAVHFWIPSWNDDITIAFPDFRTTENDVTRITNAGIPRTIEASGALEEYSRRNVFYVKNTTFGTFFGGSSQRHVMIKLSGVNLYTMYTGNDDVRITENGDTRVSEDYHGVEAGVYYREIVAAFSSGTVTQVVVDEPFEGELTPDDVLWIRRMYKCRLASDKVEIPFRTEDFADPVVNMNVIP